MAERMIRKEAGVLGYLGTKSQREPESLGGRGVGKAGSLLQTKSDLVYL